jgi:hypothetical protein
MVPYNAPSMRPTLLPLFLDYQERRSKGSGFLPKTATPAVSFSLPHKQIDNQQPSSFP